MNNENLMWNELISLRSFQMDKTFLLQRLEEFLPKIAAANEELSKLSEEELRERSCERTDGEYLMETNVLAADDMQDSPLFKVGLNFLCNIS